MTKKTGILLNDALDCFELTSAINVEGARKYFFGRESISLPISKKTEFEDIVTKMLGNDVGSKITRRSLSRLLASRIYSALKEGTRFTKQDAQAFKVELESLPKHTMRVVKEIKGIDISGSIDPVVFGRFTFYDWKRHKDLIEGHVEESWPEELSDVTHGVVVECEVSCYEMEKAYELGEAEFLKLENLIRFLIGRRDSSYEVGITGYKGLSNHISYVVNKDTVGVTHQTQGAYKALKLSDEFFSSPTGAIRRLISMQEETANSLERKILRGVEWLGQAIVEQNSASAFLKTSTAMEVIFSIQEKGVVSSSLIATISECCAQVLGTSAESCSKIERDIRDLYAVRSSVVHSGSNNVSLDDLNKFIRYIRTIILRLLDREPYASFTSAKQLSDHVSRLKYKHLDEPSLSSRPT